MGEEGEGGSRGGEGCVTRVGGMRRGPHYTTEHATNLYIFPRLLKDNVGFNKDFA